MAERSRLVESHDRAIHRLATVAEERGITIHWHDRGATREYFATSHTSPGLLHRVTMFSCSCEGFIRHSKCTHHARLLAELDELPPLPEPPTPEAMADRRAERVRDLEAERVHNLAGLTDAELTARALRAEAESFCGGTSDAGYARAAGASALMYRDELRRRQQQDTALAA